MKGARTRHTCTTVSFWEHPLSQGSLPHVSNKTPGLPGSRQRPFSGIALGKQAVFGVDFNRMIVIVIYFIRTSKPFSTERINFIFSARVSIISNSLCKSTMMQSLQSKRSTCSLHVLLLQLPPSVQRHAWHVWLSNNSWLFICQCRPSNKLVPCPECDLTFTPRQLE